MKPCVTGCFIPSFFVHKSLKTAPKMLTFRSNLVIFDASFDLNTISYFMRKVRRKDQHKYCLIIRML